MHMNQSMKKYFSVKISSNLIYLFFLNFIKIIKKFISNSSILVLNATKNLLKCEMDEVKEKVSNTKQKQQFVNSESFIFNIIYL